MSIVSEREVRTLVDRELPPVLESVPYARDLVVCSVPADVRRNVALRRTGGKNYFAFFCFC